MPRLNTPQDVWRGVDIRGVDECWPYTGCTNASGYGAIQIDGIGYLAHRVVYALCNPGTIQFAATDDKHLKQFVLHRCDNPPCCNPKHLFLGSLADNIADAKKKGRLRGGTFSGEARWNAKLNQKKAEEIRWIASKGIHNVEIARLYGVCEETVRRVVIGRSYRAW